ncbi:hypothetical protein PTI98_010192 [Pleurotus ostreatus]|nr:hypothetical protein PTI98_010192 [Pleurotus ostreatus]
MSLRHPTIERLLNIWKTILLHLAQRARQYGTWIYSRRLLGIVYNIFRRLSEFRLLEATRLVQGIDAPFQPAKSLASFPLELLTLVLGKLELRDLRRARSSCRSLYAASKSRTIWLRLFQQLSDSYVIPIIPPRPLSSYNAAALESMVLQWIRVDHAWSSCSIGQQPPRQRIRCLEWQDTPFTLIEGGRWLLTTDQCGSVLAHDLDSPSLDMGTYVLIRPQDRRDHAYITSLSVCIDRSSPTLTFNLALSYDYSWVSSVDSSVAKLSLLVGRRAISSRLSIWRITLVETTDHCSKLTSKFIKSFYTRVSVGVFDASLLHSLYARIVSPWAVEIFNWEGSQSMFHVKSHVRPEGDMLSLNPHLRRPRVCLPFSDTSLCPFGV